MPRLPFEVFVFVSVRRGDEYLVTHRTPQGGAYWHGVAGAPAGWEPTLNAEHDEYRWCSRDEALALLHWPDSKEALRTL